MTSSFFFSVLQLFSCCCYCCWSGMPLESQRQPNYRVTRCWLKWPARRAFFDDIWIWLEVEGNSSSLAWSPALVRLSLPLDVCWWAASTQPPYHCSRRSIHCATGGTTATAIRRNRHRGILVAIQWTCRQEKKTRVTSTSCLEMLQ